MNIYHVNGNSKMKGPFDILDANLQRFIRIGDVIIRGDQGGCSFLFVASDRNRWSACRCIGRTTGSTPVQGNKLLFSFDGISRRNGDVLSLSKFLDLFQEQALKEFFQNALDILSYRCDLWDLSVFYNLNTLVSIGIDTAVAKPTVKASADSITMFESYLPDKVKDSFQSLLSQGLSLREVYSSIRKEFPKEFRQALSIFLKDHPDSSIYEK